jgi:hemoglobin/transferrin/lactoferrin receptor protein
VLLLERSFPIYCFFRKDFIVSAKSGQYMIMSQSLHCFDNSSHYIINEGVEASCRRSVMKSVPFRLHVLACLLPLSFAAQAQTEVQLAPVQVIASTPTQDGVIAKETLEKTQAHDMRDVFRADTEISIGGGGNPATQKIYVRSMEESMLNVSIDGATQNGHIYHHQSALSIDPQLIKRVEVEKGTGAASAGPGALGGAMRIYTVDARDLLASGETSGVRASASVMSNRGWRGMGTVYGVMNDQVDALFSGSMQELENFKSGGGEEVPNSSSSQRNYLLKLGVNVLPQQRVSFSHQHSQDEGVRNTRANMLAFAHPVVPNEAIPQKLDRDTSTLKYEARNLGPFEQLESTLYRSNIASDRTNGKGRNYGEDITTSGMDVALASAIGNHLLKYGVNWRKEESAARNILDPFKYTGSGKEEMRVLGGYAEGLLYFGPVSLSAGLRFDDYSYQDNHGQSFDSNGFSPSVGASWQVTDSLKLKAGHSRALRGVGLKEAFMLDIAQWKNAASIDAETAQNTEVGFVFDQAGFSVAANLYQQEIDKFINSYVCGPRQACRGNTGTAKINGYELSAAYRQGGFKAGMSVADHDSELNGRPMSDIDLGLGTSTGRTWLSHAAYQWAAWDMGWQGRFVESLDYAPVTGGAKTKTKAGYGIHDVYVSWLPLQKDTLRLNLAIKNMFDQSYYDQATYGFHSAQGRILGYRDAGRDIRLEAAVRF